MLMESLMVWDILKMIHSDRCWRWENSSLLNVSGTLRDLWHHTLTEWLKSTITNLWHEAVLLWVQQMIKLGVKRVHPQLMHKMEENLMLNIFVVVDKLLLKCPKCAGIMLTTVGGIVYLGYVIAVRLDSVMLPALNQRNSSGLRGRRHVLYSAPPRLHRSELWPSEEINDFKSCQSRCAKSQLLV